MLEQLYASQLNTALHQYLVTQSEQELVDLNRLHLDLRSHQGQLLCFLCNGPKCIREVPVTELIQPMMPDPSQSEQLQAMASQFKTTLQEFLITQVDKNLTEPSRLHLDLRSYKGQVRCFLYDGPSCQREVPMTELVQHFIKTLSHHA